MKRTLKLALLSLVTGAAITGVAVAASSPTVVSGPATKIGQTAAVLTGKVNPNGRSTGYEFAYGPTTAYGGLTAAKSAGSGTKTLSVSQTITGLTPGTVYHYRIGATSSGGTALGADRTFTTAGHPPAAVVTGAPVNIGQTAATPTGTVNPEGASTDWYVQYGLSTAYGLQSSSQPLSPVNSPLPVSATLTGLSPATLFHYRVVAVHGGGITSVGADATFFTEPAIRPRPGIRARVAPRRDSHAPYTFTTRGTLAGAGFIPAAQRCAGNVGIRFYNGRRQLAFVVAPVGGNCGFSAAATFRRLRGPAPARVKVRIDYRGTPYVAPGQSVKYVTAG